MKRNTYLIFFVFILISKNIFAAQNQASEIKLPGVDVVVHLEKLKGKVVYLDFWASWCVPCKKSFPWMHDIKQRYVDQGFEVVAVNLDKDRKLADEFLQEMDVNFIVTYDASGKSASRYKLKSIPGSYLIDRGGQVYASHIGFRDKDKEQLESAIKSLLKNR